jgi:plasmid stabilization system protein ParE
MVRLFNPSMKERTMPKGDKSSYTDKQKRQAEHIEEGYEDRGVGKEEAERRAWATVNKETGGGKKSGSGRGQPRRRRRRPPASATPRRGHEDGTEAA